MTARPHPQSEPDLAGLLTDDQLKDLGKLRLGLDKILEIAEHVNQLALETGLYLRPVDVLSCHLMANDISRIFCAHFNAEDRIRAAALAAVEEVTL